MRLFFSASTLGAALLLWSSTGWAMPSIIIDGPGSGAVPDSVAVTARVGSTYVVTSVVATIGSASTDLVPSGGTYTGTLDLSAVPLGAATLTITAKDANGETATATRPVTHDRPFPF